MIKSQEWTVFQSFCLHTSGNLIRPFSNVLYIAAVCAPTPSSFLCRRNLDLRICQKSCYLYGMIALNWCYIPKQNREYRSQVLKLFFSGILWCIKNNFLFLFVTWNVFLSPPIFCYLSSIWLMRHLQSFVQGWSVLHKHFALFLSLSMSIFKYYIFFVCFHFSW